MNAVASVHRAVTAPNQFVEVGGRTLAFRSIGEGRPLLLCTRFRGNMDVWDPAFLDGLADEGFRVITFDYSGLGLSTGEATYNPAEMVRDPIDLMTALELTDVVLGGWSLGGLVAQVALAVAGERISHLLLIGTNPPGHLVKLAEQLFYDTAVIEHYGLKEEEILFFEPKSEISRKAAAESAARIAERTQGRSPAVPIAFARANIGDGPRNPIFPADAVLEVLKTTTTPILHLGGDHDIIFPVENWYALNQALPTLHLITYPSAGHGPQHQYPRASAEHIASFMRSTR
ncbi:alpha/beta fold hydrolase [Caulobacter endophyticus]|uniref:Alpha/beta hydrolase n=1 Tax=Caulobacter endophyticus TaxID=2172652 RepID=A0A2T9K406_9CAUL|nr:alpha/beta hydrolase [Caulobacter endophyticus]PVM90541.1 alpha/beta hydrolase [Caulobacter endophyticus]